MKPRVEYVDWGVVDYAVALEEQRELFEELVTAKDGRDETAGPEVNVEPNAGWFVFCEHPHVYTLGRSGKTENLLVSETALREKGAALHHIERGGDITYHGPGQIVGYPILDLGKIGLGLRQYIEALELAVIETVAHFGITAERIPGKTGVWVSGSKICAIGVKASRGVVMHGFALNVATDLRWFDNINPCGFAGGAVTSIERETGKKIAQEEVKRELCERLKENLKINI